MPPPTNLPQVHHHPSPLASLPAHLLPHLPYSLPFLRRLQHHTSTSPTAHVFATFSPTGPSPPCDRRSKKPRIAALFVDRARAPETECWVFSSWETEAAALQAGATSGEEGRDEEDGGEKDTDAGPSRQEAEEEARLQLLALFSAVAGSGSSRGAGHAADDHLPEHHPQDDLLPPIPRREKGEDTTPLDLLITGSLSETLFPLLAGPDLPYLHPSPVISRDIQHTRSQLAQARSPSTSQTSPAPNSTSTSPNENRKDSLTEPGTGIISSISIPYMKWLIPSSSSSSSPQDAFHADDPPPPAPSLPQNYNFSPLQSPNDLAHVLTRTSIPRTVKTLATLGSVGVRYSAPDSNNHASNPEAAHTEGELIAWAFLGVDGSLSSLHVEPPHRGMGLAKAVCRRLFRGLDLRGEGGVGMGFRSLPRECAERAEDGRGMVHSDVAEGNVESAGVARGLGGRVGWRVRWVGVDLGAVREGGGGLDGEGV